MMSNGLKYKIIKEQLETDIRSGVFKTGKLPALKHLCEQYDTSLMTINKVVKLLEQEGLVTCYAGAKGTWVNDPLPVAQSGTDTSSHSVNLYPFITPKVQLTYFNLDSSATSKAMWTELADLFTSEYPWIELEFINAKSHYEHGIFDEVKQADVIQTGSQDLKWLAQHCPIMPLATFLAADTTIDTETFLKSVWTTCQIDGTPVAMPMGLTIPLLYAKESVSEAAGKAATWEHFQNAVSTLQNSNTTASLNIGLWTYWQSFFKTLNISSFNSAEGKKNLKQSLELIKSVTQQVSNRFDLLNVYQRRDIINQFTDGDVSLFCGYSFYLQQLAEKDTTWQAFPMPLSSEGCTTIQPIVNVINQNSKHKHEAWLFLRFLASEKIQHFLGQHLYFPVRQDILNETIVSQKNIQQQQKVYEQIQQGKCFDLSSQAVNVIYNNLIYPALNKYLNDQISIEDLIKQIISYFNDVVPIYELNE